MRENLPKELDFSHEAKNAERTAENFKGVRTALYIPEVLFSSKRVLVMEYIRGGRVDDLEYLNAHAIDRNKVAIELSSIFSRMVHLSGWFHADPHPGEAAFRNFRPSSDPCFRKFAGPPSTPSITISL